MTITFKFSFFPIVGTTGLGKKVFQFNLIKGTREEQITLLDVDGFLHGLNIGAPKDFKASAGTLFTIIFWKP